MTLARERARVSRRAEVRYRVERSLKGLKSNLRYNQVQIYWIEKYLLIYIEPHVLHEVYTW